MKFKEFLKNTFELVKSANKLKELHKTVTLKQGIIYMLIVIFIAQLFVVLLKASDVLALEQSYPELRITFLVVDLVFVLFANVISLLVFGYLTAAISKSLFSGKGDKQKTVGLIGYSQAPFFFLAIIFLLLNLFTVDPVMEKNWAARDNMVIPHTYIAPTSLAMGGLTAVGEGVFHSTRIFYERNPFETKLISIIGLVLALWGAIWSFWLSINAIAIANKIDVVSAISAGLVAAFTALLIRFGIVFTGFLAKYIIALIYFLATQTSPDPSILMEMLFGTPQSFYFY